MAVIGRKSLTQVVSVSLPAEPLHSSQHLALALKFIGPGLELH